MKHIFIGFLLLLPAMVKAQDTTWVQTLTFDSIATRRAIFQFPQELNSKRFEKVLMYYKLKCSPLTPWDQYDCGEWDYLTYARVFDHTGVMDSVRVDGNLVLANFESPATVDFDLFPFTHFNTYTREEKNRSNPSLIYYLVNTINTNSSLPFDVTKNGSRSQYLITAAELNATGIAAGNIEALQLYVSSFLNNGELKYPSIRLKSTSLSSLSNFEETGFTEVYNASRWNSGSQNELIVGPNDFLFYQPFVWNGTDNIIVEFYYENTETTNNNILFQSESISGNTALGYEGLNGVMNFNGSNKALSELSDFDMGNEMTIAFWAKGNGAGGTNTSILEAWDTLNNRIVNLHFPWSDNNIYFDAGSGTSYDRINKSAVNEIDNAWNHWAFVKNAATGTMTIYKNGVLWHSGTGKNMPIGYVHRMQIGSNIDFAYLWKGAIDEFQIYKAALSQSDIQAWMNKKLDNTHPNWSSLLVYHDFDNNPWATDNSDNDNDLMPSEFGMYTFGSYPVAGVKILDKRPAMAFAQGSVNGALTTSEHPMRKIIEPTVIFEQTPLDRHFDIVSSRIGQVSANENTYDSNNQLVSQNPFTGMYSMINQMVTYYKEPFELVNDVEIGRYITPYGIGFDLGASGFNYIYDVTDYQHYLKNAVDLEAHNTQELIDLRFAFIEGIPPRDLHKREPIWSDWKSYQYSAMDNNTVLQSKDMLLSDTSFMFKIKTRFTGHGHNGSVNCCEWDSKDHQISINGTPRFNWEIWQESECGDNPNTAQGGTWPYAREGWCPGDMVKEYDHELTPYVTPGQTVAIDYDIENVPANDQAQGNGNYIVAMDLISYSAPNFQHDAAIIDVLNPNNYEYYKKFNPTCSYPRIILQNTGAQPLTQCTIQIYIENDKVINYNWTGNLGFLQKEIVEIPVDDITWWQNLNPGQQTFHAEVTGLENGTFTDEYSNNNIKTTKFQSPSVVEGPFFVWFITNNKASENKYTLMKDNGDIVFQRTNMTNTTHYKDTFDLEPGCYSIILEDFDHDGLSFWYSQQVEGESSGTFMLRKVGGTTIKTFPGDFGHYYRYNFSIGLENLTLDELESKNNLFLYPNPASNELYVDFGGTLSQDAELNILDLSGRLISSSKMNAVSSNASANLDISGLTDGLYLIQLKDKGINIIKEFVKYQN